MIRNQTLPVAPEDDGTRLDLFLARRFPSSFRGAATGAVARGEVTVNGRPCLKSARLRAGDTIEVASLLEQADVRVEPNPAVRVDVVYEDADLVAVNKPAGVAVHPLDARERETLANGLVARYPETAGIGDQPLFPSFVHRIDTDTSGLVVAARTPAAYTDLRSQFQQRQVRKLYTALVHGRVEEDGAADCLLAHHPRRPGLMIVVAHAQRAEVRRPMRAVSVYRVVERFGNFTLLEVEIRTGVTHQIRCQLAALGHPVAGDKVYLTAEFRRAAGPARHFLHAAHLALRQPSAGTALNLTAPLAEDLQRYLNDLRG